jgi:hypothetical protein
VQLQAAFVESAEEKEKDHFTSIVFTFQKTYEENSLKWLK